MTTWNGQGLPPVAEQRMARFSASPLRTSLLSVPAAVSLQSVGFEAVGEVMGCIVQQITWAGYGGCGLYMGPGGYGGGGFGGPVGIVPGMGYATSSVQGSNSRFAGYGPYVRALTRGYETALGRLLMEATAMGADGVVGIRLTQTHLGSNSHEFVALGTAVRGRSRLRPATPFTTDLSGADVAKLLLSGWVPAQLHYAVEVAIRHDDYRTRAQAGAGFWNNANVEVEGYTDLVQHTRSAARDLLTRKVGVTGANGSVISQMGLRIWALEIGEGHTDHVAEATFVGTSLAQFDRRSTPTPAPLTMIPTRPLRAGARSTRPARPTRQDRF